MLCAEKHQVSIKEIIELRKGSPSGDNNINIKKFSHCILNLAGFLDNNGRFHKHNALKSLDTTPVEVRPLVETAINRCHNRNDGIQDILEAAYAVEKCIFEGAPDAMIYTFSESDDVPNQTCTRKSLSELEQFLKTANEGNLACAEENHITTKEIIELRKGSSSGDNNLNVKKFAHCILKLGGLLDDDSKFDRTNALKTLEVTPVEVRGLIEAAINRCHNRGDNIADIYDQAYVIEKCFFEGAPDEMIYTFDAVPEKSCAAKKLSELEEFLKAANEANLICAEKNHITTHEIIELRKGSSSGDNNLNVKKFAHCILTQAGFFDKNSRFDLTSALKTLESTPIEVRDLIENAINRCHNRSEEVDDIYEYAYIIEKCIFEGAPDEMIYTFDAQIPTIEEFMKTANEANLLCAEQNYITTNEIIELRKGTSSGDNNINVKKFAQCILTLASFLDSNGNFDRPSALKTLEVTPIEVRNLIEAAINRCHNRGDGIADKLEVAYVIEKCIFEGAPDEMIYTFG